MYNSYEFNLSFAGPRINTAGRALTLHFSRPLKSRHVRPRWTLAIARLDGADERIPTRGRMPTFGAFWSTRTEPRPERIFKFDGSD